MAFAPERIAAIEAQVGFPICGASTGEALPCRNKAGKATDHLGSGRCKFHGGRNQSPASKSWKHGRSSSIKHPVFEAKLKEFESDTDVFDLREQIIQLKAIAALLIENDEFSTAQKTIVDVSKVVERLNNIERGRKYVISIENVGSIIAQARDVIFRHVQDEVTRRHIAEDLANIQFSGADAPLAIEGDFEAEDE